LIGTFDKHNIEIPLPYQIIYWGEEMNPLKLAVSGENKEVI